jgi:hypothetical protein
MAKSTRRAASKSDGTKTTSNELRALLSEVQTAAVDGTQGVATVLRKCAVLASRLNNSDFKSWVAFELNGYPRDADVPPYRTIPAQAHGNLVGPLWAQMNGVPIPSALLPEKQRAFGELVHLRQPISTLEELATADENKGRLEAVWPGNLIAMMQGKFNDWQLITAWQQIPRSAITGLVDTVRNRILEFTLELEQEVPSGDAPVGASTPAKVEQLYQTIIHGNVTGNIATGSPGAVQTTTVNKGDVQALIVALKKLGLPKDDTDEIATIVREEGAAEALGPKTAGWITRISTRVRDGGLKLAEGVTVGTVVKLLMSYLGLS